MLNNLLGKGFKQILAILILVGFLSFESSLWQPLNYLSFFLIVFLALYFTWRNLANGLYFILAELACSSMGYLFWLELGGQKVSLRLALFVILIAGWVYHYFKTRQSRFFSKDNAFLNYYLVLLFFILAGLFNGLAHQPLIAVLLDFNAWIFFLLAPVFFDAIGNLEIVRNCFRVLIASSVYLSLKTFVLLMIFVHGLVPLDPVYTWIRDNRIGEITLAGDGFFRIFIQSQIYILLTLMFLLVFWWLEKQKKEKLSYFAVIAVLSLALIISLSRSYWLGLMAGFVYLLCLYIFLIKKSWLEIAKKTGLIIALVIVEIVFLGIVTGNFFGKVVTSRLDDPTLEPAGSSRIAQLKPLEAAISRQPVLGYGFGKTVTYQSDDPRIRKAYPDGWYTTYAFEWGYLDIWLKIGLLGLLAYLALLAKIFFYGLKFRQEGALTSKPSLGLMAGLLALAVTSVFSPYLNHPLGIGFLLLASAMLFYFKEYDANQ